MIGQIVEPIKGGNICNRYIITKQQREALYRAVSADNDLSATINRAASVYSKVVAGVSDALVDSKTGWVIDDQFKGENNKTEPALNVPNIESTTGESNTEIWDYNIPTPESFFDGAGLNDSKNTVSCITMDSLGRIFTCSSWKTAGNEYVLLLKCFDENGQLIASAQPDMGLRSETINNFPRMVIPIACGVYQSGSSTKIRTLCKCQNCQLDEDVYLPQIVLFENTLNNATFSACSILDYKATYYVGQYSSLTPVIQGRIITTDNNDFPIVDASWNTYSATMGYVYLQTDDGVPSIRCSDSSYYTPSTWVADWVGLTCSNNTWFLGYRSSDQYIGVKYGSSLATLSNEKSISLQPIDGQYPTPQIKAFCFDQNYENIIIGYYVSSTAQYIMRIKKWSANEYNTLMWSILGYSKFPVLVPSAKFVYILYQYNSSSTISVVGAYSLESNELSAYTINIGQTELSSGIYKKGLYIGSVYKTSSQNRSGFVFVDSYLTQTIIIGHRVPSSAPLTALVNLTHSTGAKLQISCNNSSTAMNLYDKDGNALYRSDLGFSYVSRNNGDYELLADSIDLDRPSLHIASNNTNAMLYNEAQAYTKGTSWIYDGDLEYYIVSSYDGNMVALWVKYGDNPLACIIGGDLINSLYYKDIDTTVDTKTAYISLGFVNSTTSQPSSTMASTNIFLAPNPNGWGFCGGKYLYDGMNIEYECQLSSYSYTTPALALSANTAYTMPLILNIANTSGIYDFDGQSGFKGELNRTYLVQIRPSDISDSYIGHILDNGNYLYLGNLWAIGWDYKNTAANNPYSG